MGKKKNNKKAPTQSEDSNLVPDQSEDVTVESEDITQSIKLQSPTEKFNEETKEDTIGQQSCEKSDAQQIVTEVEIVKVVNKEAQGEMTEQSDEHRVELRAQLEDKKQQIKDLNADRQIMQQLLEKSQEENEDLSQKLKLSEAKVKELESKMQELQNFKLQRNQVQQIVARIKVGEVGYTLIKNQQNKTEWYQDSAIINIQEQLATEYKGCSQVNYSTVFTEIKNLEKSVADCMQQYEERLTRVNKFMEESNESYLKTQDELKQVRLKQESDMRARDTLITNLIDRSQSLKQILMKVKGRDCLNQIELNVSKLMELKPPDSICTELRDHILDVYQRVILSQLKTFIRTDDNLHTSKEALRVTTEKLAQTEQLQKEYISKMEDRFDQQTMELARFKSEHFSYMTESSEKIRELQKELDQQINYEYVKNVLIQYFMSNDHKVHAKLLTVVFTAMNFSVEEQQRVKEAFTANNTSYMGKIMGY